MTSMYFRKAFKKPGLGSKYISERNIADLSRSDATYAVYKQLRGSPPYFAANKKRAIAMVRQLGSTDLFLISFTGDDFQVNQTYFAL